MKKKPEESYRIFARKFRPETFDAVVGQETVTKLLRNALKTGRLPQSFLFSGPRGIGKTSTARILAKALNCEKGPTESPCNECTICQEITRAASLDVLEIDGASNRGIDEIRTLRENVKFKPAQARFKIYIIDEVHQITHDGFNALLKTLEEPPEHVKFIFATTEPHKVPLTILSRCQRFNFRRIPTETIAEKLKEIAKTEHLKPEPQALYLMARASDGSLRDAETLLDQLSVLSQGEIKEEDVLFALGLAGEEVYLKLLEALQKKDAEKILFLTRALYEAGKDLVQFGRGLHELFRNLLLQQIAQGAEAFIELGPESKKELAKFKDIFSREELLLALSLLQNLQGDLRRTLAPPKLLIETALLKLLHLEGLQSVKKLVEKEEIPKEGLGPRLPASLRGESGVRHPEEAPFDRHSEPQRGEESRRPQGRLQADEGSRDPSGLSALRMTENIASNSSVAPTGSLTLTDVERVWPQILEAVKAKEMSTGSFLAEAALVEVADDAVVLGLPEEFQFHKEMLERPDKKKLIEEVFSRFLGRSARVQFVTAKISSASGNSDPAGASKTPPKLPEIVTQAMDIFQGSKIVRSD